MIEQLHYTWSEQGLQGRGRFQVTAASPGLADLTGEQARLALRLCRWSGGDSQDAVSYGWIDARGHRFVFRRVAAGRTEDGRPGRFAAHILVAPVEMITVPDLLGNGSKPDLWWSGDPETNRELPRLLPQPLRPWIDPAAGNPPEDDVRHALEQLLAAGGSGRVSGTWQAVLAAAARCSTVIPASFGAVASFSTFEEGESADWFQLVGVGTRAGPGVGNRSPSPSAQAAAQMIVSGTAEEARLAREAADAAEENGQLRWREFLPLAAAFQALLAKGSVDCASLLPALARPGTANIVLRLPRGQSVVADALLAGLDGVGAALAKSCASISRDLLRQLGINIAERNGFPSVQGANTRTEEYPAPDHMPGPATWQALLRVAMPLGRPALDGIAEAALRLPVADCSAWPVEVLQACLRSEALKPDWQPSLVKAAASPDRLHAVLADAEIPVEHRAEVIVAALSAGTLSPVGFTDQSAVPPELVNPTVVRLLRAGHADGVLTALEPGKAASVVVEIALDLPDAPLLAAYRLLRPRLSLSDCLDLVSHLNQRTWQGGINEWNTVTDDILHKSVQAELANSDKPLDPSRFQRACSHSGRGRAWQRLISTLSKAVDGRTPDLVSVTMALRTPDIAADPDARAYAVQVILGVADPKSVSTVLSRLIWQRDSCGLQAAIAAAHRRAALSDGISSQLAHCVIEFIALGRVDNPQIIHPARELAHRWIDRKSWKTLEDQLAKEPDPVLKCLNSMQPKWLDSIPVMRNLRH